jgi:hypothetical protein
MIYEPLPTTIHQKETTQFSRRDQKKSPKIVLETPENEIGRFYANDNSRIQYNVSLFCAFFFIVVLFDVDKFCRRYVKNGLNIS